MNTKIYSAATMGISAHLVDIEVDLSLGMIQFHILGLPDAAIRESRQRIMTALKNCGFKLPERKITVNLAPADLKKEGMLFDVPIALGIMQAAGMLNVDRESIDKTIFLGELSLDGTIRPVRGVLPISSDARVYGKSRIIVPEANAREAALVPGIEVIGVNHLVQLIHFLRQECSIAPTVGTYEVTPHPIRAIDLNQVRGQRQGKRALQIAAAGRHNLLFIGSPGSGKTMLAQRIVTLMPPLSFDEMIETSKVYSISGKLTSDSLIIERPFRSPHHTISTAGLVGGGSYPTPGEVSLAHQGILFLDELTEFKKTTLEALRQPLEDKIVSIARAQQTLTFPASCLFLAALNPCPCGYWGDKRRTCTCASREVSLYLKKLSGPLLDRIDVQVYLPSLDYDTVMAVEMEGSSQDLAVKVKEAVAIQRERFPDGATWNGTMSTDQIDQFCVCTPAARDIIKKAFDKLNLSMRGYHKLLKLARTIADMDASEQIDRAHMQEALMYRSLDQYLEKVE